MGEIYKATDVRLGRSIAIKVLPAHKASDLDRLRRFEQEARAGSALSHPNIMTIYDVGVSDSMPYLAAELIEGETLRELLLPGALPTKRLLEIGLQIAEGLAAAHEGGVIHRDLKPDNVMISRHGLVKILDFGLAKVPPSPSGSADSVVDTQAAAVTRFGEIVGTAGYMSPEQARGEPLDFRSDQFSLGAVLYEMATGRRAFQRGTYIDTLCAILIDQPEPIARIQPGVPPPLRWIIERCLAKKAEGRYPSTRDIARELRDLKEHLGDSRGPVPASAGDETATRSVSPLGALLAAVGVAAVSWFLVGGRRGSSREPNFGWR
jgi:serine/threonine protein kinase